MLRKVSGLVVRSCTAHTAAKGQLWEQPRLQLIQDLTDTADLHDAYLAQYRCCPGLGGLGSLMWGVRMHCQGQLHWLNRLSQLALMGGLVGQMLTAVVLQVAAAWHAARAAFRGFAAAVR